MKKYSLLFLFLWWIGSVMAQINPANDCKDIFEDVQQQHIFKDQKAFVDCIPLLPIDSINKKYQQEKQKSSFDLTTFVRTHFKTGLHDTSSIFRHMDMLWDKLTKPAEKQDSLSSLIALPHPYVVPGGRFREIYYWDSYFTMLGLEEAKRIDIIESMVNNFAFLIDQYGFIPNGNRTYYLSRSQPPFFSLMVELLAKYKGDSIYTDYKNALEKEYAFWMTGSHKINNQREVCRRVVRLDESVILNRYWDEFAEPRPESYIHDLETFRQANCDSTIFRNLRAAAESGWDFSSRWFRDEVELSSIRTIELIPVDLNCLLHHLEISIMKAYKLGGNDKEAETFKRIATHRKNNIIKYCWNDSVGYFYDYNWKEKKQSARMTLAGVFPLFFQLADDQKASLVRENMKDRFLKDGGVVTTLNETNQQWDYPNGWAPLQWVCYKSCKNYSYHTLAKNIAVRWTALNLKVFFETGKMLEKYNVVDTNIKGGGGEYPLQDGFGWTNGVFLKMWNEEHLVNTEK